MKQQLAELYTAPDGEGSNTEVRVTLYQIMRASMNISTSLSDAAVCAVLMNRRGRETHGAPTMSHLSHVTKNEDRVAECGISVSSTRKPI